MAAKTMQPITRIITNITGTSAIITMADILEILRWRLTFVTRNVWFHKATRMVTVAQYIRDIFC